MQVYLTTDESRMVSELQELISFHNGKKINANFKKADIKLELQNNRYVYLFGDIFYYIKEDRKVKFINKNSHNYLKKIFSEYKIEDIISCLEGQYIGMYVDNARPLIRIFSDRYARLDTFYTQNNSNFYLATALDFIFKNVKPEYEQKMLAHLFCVYGWYVSKGMTIYKNVRRLRVGEILTLSESGIESEIMEFEPHKIEDYTDKDLETYYRILRESVISRANCKGKTWVSSSSGWDSSILLGLLVDEFGPKNVAMLTGSMKYSEGSKTINIFEMNKIKKIGSYFGIKPEIVGLDYKSSKAPECWKKVLPYYRSKHMYTYASFNFTRLSDKLSATAGEGQTIFNGETSDSFHNFGFSQFVTFFHSKKSFTEYADKMNCYLYGPSFLKKVLDGTYKKDKVFQIFRKMYSGVEFDSNFSDKKDLLEGYLFPFFYGGPRIPFAKTYANPALTVRAQKEIYHFPFRDYMPEALSVSEKDVYSWLIYLYHSFHSQGSTVNIQKHAMEYHGHHWRSPFNDYRLIDFLSKAPESWGRGLEFNNTKYPLKWVAKNKIKFPYKLLEKAPHSYLYDVIEGFSLSAEITYRSGVAGFFKDTLRNSPYREILGDEYFNLHYLDNLVAGYLKGKEVIGIDFNNLVSLITLCITGWY